MTLALIDGNAFYCSCERVFDPKVRKRRHESAGRRTDILDRLGVACFMLPLERFRQARLSREPAPPQQGEITDGYRMTVDVPCEYVNMQLWFVALRKRTGSHGHHRETCLSRHSCAVMYARAHTRVTDVMGRIRRGGQDEPCLHPETRPLILFGSTTAQRSLYSSS